MTSFFGRILVKYFYKKFLYGEKKYLMKSLTSSTPDIITNREKIINEFLKSVDIVPSTRESYRKGINKWLGYLEKNNIKEPTLKTMKDSVYYWNLVNSFIPDYYSEYLPSENDPKREAAIKRIADDFPVSASDEIFLISSHFSIAPSVSPEDISCFTSFIPTETV